MLSGRSLLGGAIAAFAVRGDSMPLYPSLPTEQREFLEYLMWRRTDMRPREVTSRASSIVMSLRRVTTGRELIAFVDATDGQLFDEGRPDDPRAAGIAMLLEDLLL